VKRQSGKGNPSQISVPTACDRHSGHSVQGTLGSSRMHERIGVVPQLELSSF